MGGFGRGGTAAVSLLFALAALGAGVGAPTARAAAPVDVRGSWSGVAVADIGTFANTFTITGEDFTTGVVTGEANSATYTFGGVVTGNHLHSTSSQIGTGYSATSEMDVAPDGNSMSGTFKDTNGRSGTEHFTRTGPAPSAAAPTPAAGATPTPAPGSTCTFGGAGGFPGDITTTTAVDPSVVQTVGDAAHPITSPFSLAIDTGDPRGRVFIASGLPNGGITIIDGGVADATRIGVEATVSAAAYAGGIAVDPGSGHVYVTDTARCRLLVLDGRAATPGVIASVDLPGNPGAVAVGPGGSRILVSMPQDGQVLVLDGGLTVVATFHVADNVRMAIDTAHNIGYIATGATGATGQVTAIDLAAAVPTLLATTSVPAPAAIALDPDRETVFTVDSAAGQLVSWHSSAAGGLTRVGATTLSLPPVTATGPVSSQVGILFAEATHELLVVAGSSSSGVLLTEQADGTTAVERQVLGLAGGVAAALDPASGRVYVALEGPGRVVVLATAAAAAPSLAYSLPGPLEISLAPQDVARSIGIMSLIMLLLGAPTPIFNSTLSANRVLIERYARRKLPKRLRRATGSGSAAAMGRRIAALSTTWTGLVLYLLLVGLLYCALDPNFPFSGAPRTLFTTLFSIAFGTAVSQVPGEIYVRRRYKEGGNVRVVVWTLGLAVGCVLITRITGVQPGYVYGIIGGFTFKAALTKDDSGRMTWRGMLILLAAGFAAWILRIPFQPGTGLVGGDVGAIANQLLAGIFIGAVESSAIGMIPLRFLSGHTLFTWSRGRWALLWGLGLVLFAHVILYPVSSFEPKPSATGLWTVLASVAVYGGIAIGFWAFFQRRSGRHEARVRRAAANAARAARAAAGPEGPEAGPGST